MDWTPVIGPAVIAAAAVGFIAWINQRSTSAAREVNRERDDQQDAARASDDRIRELAREEIAAEIRAALAEHTEALFQRINGTYRRRTECDLIEAASQQRVEAAERDIRDLQKTAHHSPCENSRAILTRLVKIEGT